MASCMTSVGCSSSASSTKLSSKQSRRVLHRPVSPYEREKSPVSAGMDGNPLHCDNSEIQSLLLSIQELPRKKHILNPVYLLYADACTIYSTVIRGCNPPRGIVDSKDRETKLQIYSLVFEAIQYVQVVKHWLEESGIYEKYFELHGYEHIVEVMAYDLQRQRFSLAPPHSSNENVPSQIRAVANALWSHKTKLSASLAKIRIEQDAPSIQYLLPDRELTRLQAWKRNPCYSRITKLNDRDEVVTFLTNHNLKQVQELSAKESKAFCVLRTKKDIVAFSPDCRELLHSGTNYVVTSGKLVIQDHESCWFAECVGKMIAANTGDIVITHLWSGVTVLHIASLTAHKVIVYGVTPLQNAQLQEKISLLDLHNISLINEPFMDATPDDALLENLSIILCCPISTLSAVNNPVDYLLQDGGDDSVALLLAPAGGCKVSHKTMQAEQVTTLLHAMKFSEVEQIVYSTESSLEEENGGVVRQAMASHSKRLQSGNDRKLRKFHPMPHVMRSFFQSIDSSGSFNCCGNANRYHITVLEKEPLPPATPPKDVIARAVANGLLSGINVGDERKVEKVKKKTKTKLPGFARPTAASDAKTRTKSRVHHKKTKKRKPTH